MKGYKIILLLIIPVYNIAQEQILFETEQQLETLTESAEDAEYTDDAWLQQMEYLKKNKLNLNTASEADLLNLQLLTTLQINQLINYRKLFGNLLSLYELQAVPGWDLELIQQLRPYISVAASTQEKQTLLKQMNEGDHALILRFSAVLEKAKGYLQKDSSRSHYTGDPTRLMFRYKYQYRNLLQYGITLSKDAGEPLYDSKSGGFDFYSFHFFRRKTEGMLKALALGDYTINMGQGLIHWQGFSFGTSGNAMHIMKQSVSLRQYNSSGAFNFHRGAGIQLEKNNWRNTTFLSLRNLDAKINPDDTDGNEFVSSIHTSGYHRTPAERSDKGKLQLLTYGTSVQYRKRNWYSGLNMIQYTFSKRIQKDDVPYNYFALAGKHFSNYSLDYGLTLKNIYTFGEIAIDRNYHSAFIKGVLISVHPKASLSFLYRTISPSYQAFYGNALIANNAVSNEKGIFAGLAIKPYAGWNLEWYVDIYHFPWLKYRTDAPSYGKSFFAQLVHRPNKLTEIYSRYRSRQKSQNQRSETNAMNEVLSFYNHSWRTQISYKINQAFSIRHRFELLWYHPEKTKEEKGFLAFFDVFYKPAVRRLSLNTRIQYFESDSYNSRLYAYENDVLYYFSVPVFYEKGTRYYINCKYQFTKNIKLWLKWGQTFYYDSASIGSGLDEIQGSKKSEIRMLLSANF